MEIQMMRTHTMNRGRGSLTRNRVDARILRTEPKFLIVALFSLTHPTLSPPLVFVRWVSQHTVKTLASSTTSHSTSTVIRVGSRTRMENLPRPLLLLLLLLLILRLVQSVLDQA